MMPESNSLRVVEKQNALVPWRTSVQRHPTARHRVLLQFDNERPIELNVHAVMLLCESLLTIASHVTPSEYEMELGSAERQRLACRRRGSGDRNEGCGDVANRAY